MLVPEALVLCGGAGRRLGGLDKPLEPLAGRPLIEHVLARVVPQAARVMLSANRHRDRYRAYGHAVVDDGARVDYGPLAGVLAGLAQANGEFLLCVPGDAPLLPPDLAQRLVQAADAHAAEIAYVEDGSGPQPLCALIRCTLREDLRDYLDAGGRTPREWFRRHACATADYREWPRWAWSVNTAEEWRAAENALAALTLNG